MKEENCNTTDQLITLNHEEHYHSVKVLGSFDNLEWQHLPMSLNRDQWEVLLKLLVGKEYEFKFFINDGIWHCSNKYNTKATHEGFENNVLKVVSAPKTEEVKNSEETYNSQEYNEEELSTEVLPILSPYNELNESQVSEDESEEFIEDDDINVNQFSFIQTNDELESEIETKPLSDSDFDNQDNLGPNLNEEGHQSVNGFENDNNESTQLNELNEPWVHSMHMSTTLVKGNLDSVGTEHELNIAQNIRNDRNNEKLPSSETNLNIDNTENLFQLKSEINETLGGTEDLKLTESELILDTTLPKTDLAKSEANNYPGENLETEKQQSHIISKNSKSNENQQNNGVGSNSSQNTLENLKTVSSTCSNTTVTLGNGKTSEVPSQSTQTENISKKSSKKRNSNKKSSLSDNNEDRKKQIQPAPKSLIWSLFDFFFVRTFFWALSWIGIKK